MPTNAEEVVGVSSKTKTSSEVSIASGISVTVDNPETVHLSEKKGVPSSKTTQTVPAIIALFVLFREKKAKTNKMPATFSMGTV